MTKVRILGSSSAALHRLLALDCCLCATHFFLHCEKHIGKLMSITTNKHNLSLTTLPACGRRAHVLSPSAAAPDADQAALNLHKHNLPLTVESNKHPPHVCPLHKADVIAAPVLFPVAVAGSTHKLNRVSQACTQQRVNVASFMLGTCVCAHLAGWLASWLAGWLWEN